MQVRLVQGVVQGPGELTSPPPDNNMQRSWTETRNNSRRQGLQLLHPSRFRHTQTHTHRHIQTHSQTTSISAPQG